MTDIDPRDMLVDDTISIDPVTGEEEVGPIVQGRTRRLILRGGPGSGHRGHKGRPGERGGSLPDSGGQSDAGDVRSNIAFAMNKALAERKTTAFGLKDYPTASIILSPDGTFYAVKGTLKHGELFDPLALEMAGFSDNKGMYKREWFKARGLATSVIPTVKFVKATEGNERSGDLFIDIPGRLTRPQKDALRDLIALYHEPEYYVPWFALKEGTGDKDGGGTESTSLEAFLTVRGGPGSGHFGHEGRPGKQGGSQPGDFHESEDDGLAEEHQRVYDETAKDFEARLLAKYGEAQPENGTWIGPSGKFLVPDGDHQETAIELLGRESKSDPKEGEPVTKEWVDKGLRATNDVVESGLIRYNMSDGLISFDVPPDGATKDQKVSMAILLEKIASDEKRWPSVNISVGLPFRGLLGDEPMYPKVLEDFDAYRFLDIDGPDKGNYDYIPPTERSVVARGGPGSGHFGHEGRPGQVGGSQPGDFHSAEPGTKIDADSLKETLGFSEGNFGPKDVERLESELRRGWVEVDAEALLTAEFWLAPSGDAFNVMVAIAPQDRIGHGEVADWLLRDLFQRKVEAGELGGKSVEEAKKNYSLSQSKDEGETKIEVRDESGDNLTLALKYGTDNPWRTWDVMREGDNKWAAQRDTGLDPVKIVGTRDEMIEYLAGETFRYKGSWEIRDKRSEDRTAMVFHNYLGHETAPGKPYQVLFEYDHPLAEESEFATLDEAVDYATEVSAKIGGEFDSAHFRGDRERLLASFGFVRVSRGGGSTGSQVGITFNSTVRPTPAQVRVMTKVARQAIEEGGEAAWEASGSGGDHSFSTSDWPSAAFTKAMQGQFVERTFALPAWAQRMFVRRGGPGSGHFGHAGRPGEVGGSQPDDFHSALIEYPDWVDSDEMKAKVATSLVKVVRANTYGNIVGSDEAGSIFSGRGWMAHDGTLCLSPMEHLAMANAALKLAGAGTSKDWGNGESVLKRMGFGRMVITSDEFYYNGPDEVTPEQGETLNALLATRTEAVFAETPNHSGAISGRPGEPRPDKDSPYYDDRSYLNRMVDKAYRLVGRSRPLVERGGPGSGHHAHEGREGKRGGSSPGDRATVEAPVGKDRKGQMDEAKRRKDFQPTKPAPEAERLGAPAHHIGPGYRVHLTNGAFAKYRAQVSSALEWASSEFKRAFGGQVEGITIYDDAPTYVEACNPELWAESLADKDAAFVEQVKDGLRKDYSRFNGAYNPVTKSMMVNTGKFIQPSGVLDTDGMMATALHEYVHWATVGAGRDEIWKETKVPRVFRSAFKGDYPQDLLKQEYVARVVAAELTGSDMLTKPGDNESLMMSEEDHENARLLIDKISNTFVAPNLEMPTTLRAAPPTERMVDVGVPDGLGNVWGRAVPESELDGLPDGSHVTSLYTLVKGEEAFEDGRTIRPDVLSLNWLDETDPARHPTRQPITKEPRPDDVTMARRSQDTVLDRVLETIGGALRELMGMKNG